MDIPQATQTEWNGGTFTNLRLHELKEIIREAAILNNLNLWLSSLEQINHELYGFEDSEEKKAIRNSLTEVADKINNYQSEKSRGRRSNNNIPPEIIFELNNMQYKLDEIFHKSGLQTALKEDAGDSF